MKLKAVVHSHATLRKTSPGSTIVQQVYTCLYLQLHRCTYTPAIIITLYMYVRHTLFLLNVTGILAGMWPCGIVTLVDELYRAESKTQVYGSVHSLMHANPSHTSDISK